MTTIRDVARQAGVSISTVSYVLSGERPVTATTRERVMTVVTDLGFRSNDLARSLKTGRSMTLGLIIPDILNPFFTTVARAAEDAASAHGYNLILCNSCNDAAREQGYLGLLRSRRVDGLIYMAGSGNPHKNLRALARQGFPLVIIDEEIQGVDTTSIFVRNREGGIQAGQYLALLGHRQVGIIGGPPALKTAQDRLDGVRAGLARHGVAVTPERIIHADYQIDGGRAAMRRLLDAADTLTAVFAANDMMAIGALNEAHDRGIAVPHDLSIVGFDDIPLATMISPALTTVEQPAPAMGRQAVVLLLAMMAPDLTPPGRRIMLDTRLRVRASTGPARTDRRSAIG